MGGFTLELVESPVRCILLLKGTSMHQLPMPRGTYQSSKTKTGTTPRLDNAVAATCQSQGNHALKHTLLNGLLDSKWDHNLLNENHAVLNRT